MIFFEKPIHLTIEKAMQNEHKVSLINMKVLEKSYQFLLFHIFNF